MSKIYVVWTQNVNGAVYFSNPGGLGAAPKGNVSGVYQEYTTYTEAEEAAKVAAVANKKAIIAEVVAIAQKSAPPVVVTLL